MELTNIIEMGVVGAYKEGKAIEAEEKNSAGYDRKTAILNRTSGASAKRAADDFNDFKSMVQAKANLDKLAQTQEISRTDQAKQQVAIQQTEQNIAIAIATKAMFLRMKETKAYGDEFRKLYQQEFGKSAKETFVEDFGTNHGMPDGALTDAQNSLKQQRLLLQESKARRLEDIRSLPGAQFEGQAEPVKSGSLGGSAPTGDSQIPEAAPEAPEHQTQKNETDPDLSTYIPESVRRKYVVVENKYYESGKEAKLAFVDDTTKISASSDKPEDHHVRSMVDIAEARKWPSIKVSGNKEFKAAVWLEASLKGIGVDGYTPSDLEKARLAAMMAKKEQTRPEGVLDNSIERGPLQKAAKSRSDSNKTEELSRAKSQQNQVPNGVDQASSSKPERVGQSSIRTYAGTLLEHGQALYEFRKGESESYFAKIETIKGVETIWGKEIRTAIGSANAQNGDEIKLTHMGQQPVTVDANVLDETGKVVGVQPLDTIRNSWKVERLTATAGADDPTLSRKVKLLKAFDSYSTVLEAAQKHPEFPELTHAAAAMVVTEKQLASRTEGERKKLLDNARANMRRDIELDKGVPTVSVKENASLNAASNKTQKKDSTTNKSTKQSKQQELAQ